MKYRPDLLKDYVFTKEELKLLKELESEDTPKWEKDAIAKSKKNK